MLVRNFLHQRPEIRPMQFEQIDLFLQSAEKPQIHSCESHFLALQPIVC